MNKKEAHKYAMSMVCNIRGQSNNKKLNKDILEKHGSRKPAIKKIKNKKLTNKLVVNQQKELIL